MPLARSRSLAVLARHRDDAHPRYQWFWDRLVAAWVPALDPSMIVGAGGYVPTVMTTPTNSKWARGPDGSYEVVRNRVSGRIQISPSFVSANGFTLVSMFTQRVLGNREPSLASLDDGTTAAAMTIDCSSGGIRRALNPPGAFDSLGLTATTGREHVAIHSITNGTQAARLDGTAGTGYSTSFSPTWGAGTELVIGSSDGALEMYLRMRASFAYLGSVASFADRQRIEAMTRTLDVFRWQRRRAYSIFSGAAATTTIRPTSDVTDGGWLNEAASNTNLYASVDDSPTNDATYVISPRTPAPDALTLGFADPGGTPPAGPMTLTIRMRKVTPE